MTGAFEGHAVPAAPPLPILALVGKKAASSATVTLVDLADTDSVLDGLPIPPKACLFDAATGSLGQGLSVAVGIALAALKDEMDRKVYCILGDGEAREGQVTEALDFIIDHNITNVLPPFNGGTDNRCHQRQHRRTHGGQPSDWLRYGHRRTRPGAIVE